MIQPDTLPRQTGADAATFIPLQPSAETLALAPFGPQEATVAHPLNDQPELTAALAVGAETEQRQGGRAKRILARVAIVAAAMGFFGGAHSDSAEADTTAPNTTTTPVTQMQSQSPQGSGGESGINWEGVLTTGIPLTIAVGGTLGQAWAYRQNAQKDRKQEQLQAEAAAEQAALAIAAEEKATAEAKATRFTHVRDRVSEKGLDGGELAHRLDALEDFVNDPEYAEKVFKTMVTYFRVRGSRDAALAASGGEPALMLNVDRTAAMLLFESLKTIRALEEADPQGRLAKARGANLSGMGEFDDELLGENPSLEGARWAGARFEKVRFIDIAFGAHMQEVRLTDAIVDGGDLSRTDLRAAYLNGTRFVGCKIGSDTQFGRLPSDHRKARVSAPGSEPSQTDQYRGDPTGVTMIGLESDTLQDHEIIAKVWAWQENGLELTDHSDPRYFRPSDTRSPLHPHNASGNSASS